MKIQFDCPESLHILLQKRCESRKVSIEDYLIDLLSEDLLEQQEALFTDDPVVEWPTKGGEVFQVLESLVESLTVVYDMDYVIEQLQEMKLWVETNPRKRPTAKGSTRFINSWLKRNKKASIKNENRAQLESAVAALESF